jgi:hypothetical protein
LAFIFDVTRPSAAFEVVYTYATRNQQGMIKEIHFSCSINISSYANLVKFENECSGSKQIKTDVPQGSVLGPILYLLYTSDIPTTEDTFLATFADDTVVLTKGTYKRYRLSRSCS